MRTSRSFLLLIAIFLVAYGKSIAQATPCGVPAIPVSDPRVPTAMSWINPANGVPQILFNPAFFQGLGQSGPLMFAYMIAHECRHHSNGDVIASQVNPMGYLVATPAIELRADCGAAHDLKAQGNYAAVQFAANYWAQMGLNPTGPNYPTGAARAQALSQCQ